MVSHHFKLKKILPFVLLGSTCGLQAQPAFFTISEVESTKAQQEQDKETVLIATSPDGKKRESVLIKRDIVARYYRLTPKQMANPHAIDFSQGCIYSSDFCRYLRLGAIDDEADSDEYVAGWRKVLMEPNEWLTSYFHKDSVNEGLVTAFANDNQAMVGYFVESAENAEKFHSQRAFFRLNKQARVTLPVASSTGQGSVSRPSVVKKLNDDFYLIGGTTSVKPVTDKLKDLLDSEKKSLANYPGYAMQAATWLVDIKTNQTYGPFLADYIKAADAQSVQTASVQDIAWVKDTWYAVGYSSAAVSSSSKSHRNRAVYWPLTVTPASQNVAFESSKTIDFEQGIPKDSQSTFDYTIAEYIRDDGLIVGRVAYQKPESRNLPIKAFTYNLGAAKAQLSFESRLNPGADHYITALGVGDIALGRADAVNQTFAAYLGSPRIAEAVLFDLKNKTIFRLNQLVGKDGYQNGSYYRIDTPVSMMADGTILATAFKYQEQEAYLGRIANADRDVVTVQLKPRATYTEKSAESSLKSRFAPYLNEPFSPRLILPVSGGLGFGAVGFLFLWLYRKKKLLQ